MKTHPFPLPELALRSFCHPVPDHLFSAPYRHAGEILAGNGYIALRASKGNWMHDEFPEASPAFLARFDALPWSHYLDLIASPHWTHTHDLQTALFRRTPISLWMFITHPGNPKPYTPAPSPVWNVRDTKVRLSHLQAIARLPRCEIYHGPPPIASSPLFFRFSGGIGIIAHDPSLTVATGSILQPITDILTGSTTERDRSPRPVFTQPGVNWPPVDTSEL